MNKMKVYVASSWRNEHQQSIVEELRRMGFEVYDFKRPNGEAGFKWSRIEEKWQGWGMKEYREALRTDYAQFGFNRDFDAMKEADICVLCLPCGRSAHLEAGWMKGAGKKVIAYIPHGERIEPELMYGLLDGIAISAQDVERMLKVAPVEECELLNSCFEPAKEGDEEAYYMQFGEIMNVLKRVSNNTMLKRYNLQTAMRKYRFQAKLIRRAERGGVPYRLYVVRLRRTHPQYESMWQLCNSYR